MSSVSSISATNTATSAGTSLAALPSQTLDQNAFLKLLVSQIQYQDPMNPKSDTDMAAQMAQFTSLQQASESSSSLAMLQASNLIGSTVTVQVDQNHFTSGVVGGVIMNNGKPQVTINGASFNLNQIISVAPTPQPTVATNQN